MSTILPIKFIFQNVTETNLKEFSLAKSGGTKINNNDSNRVIPSKKKKKESTHKSTLINKHSFLGKNVK